MQNIYTETRMIRTCSCDMSGVWKPAAILEAMQETAGVHSGLLRLSHDYFARRGIGWVLTRLKVEMQRLPHIDEEIRIETYPTPARHMFTPRTHIFYDAAGAEIGCANSLWAVMDLAERKMVKRDDVFGMIPPNTKLRVAAGMPVSVRALPGEVQQGRVLAQYTDLDTNRHVNNTKYMDWCCNALGLDVMRDFCVTAFDVNYDAEIRPGSELRTELTREGNRFVFCGFEGEKRHFAISGMLTERK